MMGTSIIREGDLFKAKFLTNSIFFKRSLQDPMISGMFSMGTPSFNENKEFREGPSTLFQFPPAFLILSQDGGLLYLFFLHISSYRSLPEYWLAEVVPRRLLYLKLFTPARAAGLYPLSNKQKSLQLLLLSI